VALNAKLEDRVIAGSAALQVANSDLEAEAVEHLRTEETLRGLEETVRSGAEMAAERASVLAEVSRVLVEDFMHHRPMLERVAQIAAVATDTACVIQLIGEDGDDGRLVPLAVDHADQAVRAELARVLRVPQGMADSPWHGLDPVFLDRYPLMDSLSVPMLARTAKIGVLSLGRFGSRALQFTDSDRKLSDDLAARVALAVENARLYENAQTAIELRDNFLTIAAHELKTPMTTILGYSQLLSYQLEHDLPPDPAPVRRSAHMIEDRIRHLARLVEQILDVSRLVASRLQLNPHDTDLVGMIRDLVAGLESRHGSHEFRVHLRHERLLAEVDPIRLKQVMANLIDNAVRYSPDGGPIDITVEQEQDDTVVLSVRDRGLGIPEEHRAHIFDRFHQAHAAASRSGMGLGLHVSREIVVLHGGKITVEFPAGGGSQFMVRLPRTNDRPDTTDVDSRR
jgi:signal transduction histidine kinase